MAVAGGMKRKREFDEDEEEDSFIEDDGGHTAGISDFIQKLGFSRGPTSVKTYMDLGGKGDDEKELKRFAKEFEEADKEGEGDFHSLLQEESRSYVHIYYFTCLLRISRF